MLTSSPSFIVMSVHHFYTEYSTVAGWGTVLADTCHLHVTHVSAVVVAVVAWNVAVVVAQVLCGVVHSRIGMSIALQLPVFVCTEQHVVVSAHVVAVESAVVAIYACV